MYARPRFVLASLFALALAGLTSPAAAQPLIVIDPGHGGTDPGAVGCSIEEADVVLDVGQRLRTQLEAAGVRVAMTRDTDTFVGLSARASFANSRSANGFVSVHSNANSGAPATGIETWIANSASARSLSLATLIQAEMVRAWGLRDRGVKRADFVVVRDTTMPSALTELAFTNNCSVDATYLSSATRRQSMAEAQAAAILEWLGVMPGGNGTLRGVVFEDQGVGTGDLSVRLSGATVRIVETGATTSAADAEANWLFTLPAGTYTVEASASGHTTASRSCEVTSGGTTWCSIGLFPSTTPVTPDAAVVSSPDAAVAPIADAAVAVVPDAVTTERVDARIPSTVEDAGGPPLTMRPNASDCACRASAPSTRMPATFLLAGLGLAVVAARRRRRATRARTVVALAGLTGLLATGGCTVEERALEATSQAAPLRVEETVAQIRRVPAQGPAVSVLQERELLLTTPEGAPVTTPFLSPDAQSVLVAATDFSALYVWRAEAPSQLDTVCTQTYCGHEPRFFGQGLVATRTPEQSSSALPGDAYTLSGARSETRLGSGGALAWVEGEDRVLLRLNGVTTTLRVGDDRFVRAELSPDRRHVVVWGLTTGLTLHRVADGARFELGEGSHPHFEPAGRALVFDRTEDEGHSLLSGDVFLVELGEEPTLRPVLVGPSIEITPTLSRLDDEGHATLAIEREGAIVLLDLAL